MITICHVTLPRVAEPCTTICTAMDRMLSSATGEWRHATYDRVEVRDLRHRDHSRRQATEPFIS